MYSVTKAFVAGLAVLSGAESQKLLFNVPPGNAINLYGESTPSPINCTAQKAFNSNISIPIAVLQGSKSFFYEIGSDIESIDVDTSYGIASIANSAIDNNILIDCDMAGRFIAPSYCSYNSAIGSYSLGSAICNISPGLDISCVLWKGIDDNKNTSVRLHATNYTASQTGFPEDTIIELPPTTPFYFKYQTNINSTMSFIAASDLDNVNTNQGQSPIYLSCSSP